MYTYMIAETIGCSAEKVRNDISMEEFWEWVVYLNGPFSKRSREASLNGWLIQTIRSMMAPKGRKPKFKDSMYPFNEVYEEYFNKPKEDNSKADVKVTVQHQILKKRQQYERHMSEYEAGKRTNSLGLYKGEKMVLPDEKQK